MRPRPLDGNAPLSCWGHRAASGAEFAGLQGRPRSAWNSGISPKGGLERWQLLGGGQEAGEQMSLWLERGGLGMCRMSEPPWKHL